jgi:hypothetical protein
LMLLPLIFAMGDRRGWGAARRAREFGRDP